MFPHPQHLPTEPRAAASNGNLTNLILIQEGFCFTQQKSTRGGRRGGGGGGREKAVSLPGFNKHSKDIYRTKGEI